MNKCSLLRYKHNERASVKTKNQNHNILN